MDGRRILVLYASQTGNAEDVAERLGREAARRELMPLVMSIDRYDPNLLPSENTVVFVASTTGQGDPPDTMKSFWRYLLQSSLQKNAWLQGVQYAVFGLGDSGYQNFNVVAMRLDKRLRDLGAKQIIPRGLGDDQHRSGYEGSLDPWLVSLWALLSPGVNDPASESWKLDPSKYRIKHHHRPAFSSSSPEAYTEVQKKWIEHERARAMVEAASGAQLRTAPTEKNLGRVASNPVFGQVVKNMRLTDETHEQDVRHLEFDLGDSGLKYSPGDVLGVFPSQSERAVNEFMERCGLDPDAFISVEPSASELSESHPVIPVSVKTLVEAVMDISSATPRRYFFEVMMHFAEAQHEKERLQYFTTAEGRDDLYNYNQRERRTVLEVLEDFPSVNLPLEWLVQVSPRLRPRYFSISSSPSAHPNEVHLTIAVVNWKTPYNRSRLGLCSNWLAQLHSKRGVVPIWITPGILKLPPPSVPLILIGPGTGCAPFRAFIEERAAILASGGEPVAPILFFFGCRYRSKDFLYRKEWESLASAGGILSQEKGGGFFVAFSRDQPQKVYVQHRIREQSKRVFELLVSRGGALFVSGSAEKMPADVGEAMEDVIESETGSDRKAVRDWLKSLEKAGRYTVEVWS